MKTIPLMPVGQLPAHRISLLAGREKSDIRILGINPAAINEDRLPIPPLGILYVAAYARQHGYSQWRIVDNDILDRRPVESFIEDIRWADIVALTGTTAQCRQAFDLTALAKQMGKLVVYGGPHAGPTWEKTLAKGIDVVVHGEGEITFTELLDAFREGRDLSTVSGISYLGPDGIPVRTGKRKRLYELDSLPFPARDLLPMERYGNKPLKRFSDDGRYLQLMMTRGCTDKCTFCETPGNWGEPVARSAENLFAEMMEVYRKYGVRYFHFQDDVFTVNQPIVRKLCYLLIDEWLQKQGSVRFEWSCLVRPDQVSYGLLCLMKLAGCVQVEMGVESGSEKLLAAGRKRYKKSVIKQAFDDARRAGIRTYGFFIVGLPGETKDTVCESIHFAKEIKADSSVWTVITPYPGTEIYDRRNDPDSGITILDDDFEHWLYKTPVVQVGDLGPAELTRLRRIANRVANGPGYHGAYRYGPGNAIVGSSTMPAL